MQSIEYSNPSNLKKYKLLFELDGTIMMSDFSNYERDFFTNYKIKMIGLVKDPVIINIENAVEQFYSYFRNDLPKKAYETQPFLLNHVIKAITSIKEDSIEDLDRLDNLIYNVEIPSLHLKLDSLAVDPESKFKFLSLVLPNE
ncbi:hypothetical protein [Peptoniphilus vaginalis]|uniref:hypothetical protein n=1 Tax=Peptoniphilus vaginalis TaxID=1756987 RepID=UPI0023F979FA|nr:hypothetical protein [Peptoniphilus vaginalis]